MPIGDLKSQIDRLPEQPGVYLYGNAAGETIYVGKARSLRDRVRSYLGARGASPKTDALLDEADSLEVVVTDSVVEALALENNLIKQRLPKYNILLRDDKNYPYLRLTTSEPFPRLLVARSVERNGDAYFGPFVQGGLARRLTLLSHRVFGLRSCNEIIDGRRGRPCLEYDIKRCLAPCVESICGQADYARAVQDARLFLEGRTDELLGAFRERMDEAAAGQRFEQAAQWRDAARAVQALRNRQQKMATAKLGDRDVFGVKVGPAGAAIQVFEVRRGRVIERVQLFAEAGTDSMADLLQATLQQFYVDREAPPEVHLPVDLPEAEDTEAWLNARGGRKVRLVVPSRGAKRGLVDLAARNAAQAYQSRFNREGAARYEGLDTLRLVLGLPALPRRIECFDISTIQGSETVASMVVCEDGRMRRAEYPEIQAQGSGLRPGGSGLRAQGSSEEAQGSGPRALSRRLRGDQPGGRPALPAAARGGRPVPGPRGRRRWEGPVVGCLCRARTTRSGALGGRGAGQEGRTRVHPGPRRTAGALEVVSGAAPAAAGEGRGPPFRGDLPQAGPEDARPQVRARRDHGGRAGTSADAAHHVWKRGRRPAGDEGGTHRRGGCRGG